MGKVKILTSAYVQGNCPNKVRFHMKSCSQQELVHNKCAFSVGSYYYFCLEIWSVSSVLKYGKVIAKWMSREQVSQEKRRVLKTGDAPHMKFNMAEEQGKWEWSCSRWNGWSWGGHILKGILRHAQPFGQYIYPQNQWRMLKTHQQSKGRVTASTY